MAEPDEGDERSGSRGVWSGTLGFGLVTIPIELHPATRSNRAGLRMLDARGAPLRRHFFCPAHEREVQNDELVRGFEVGKRRYAVVTDEELERLEPKKTRELDLRRFVPRAALDPLLFDRAYFLVAGAGGDRAYRLLCAAMEKAQRAGIATFVMREREHLAAIFADDGVLCAETLHFADELRAAPALPKGKPSPAVERRFAAAIEKLAASKLDLDELADEDAVALRALAKRKLGRGETVARAPAGREEAPEAGGAQIIDLVEELKRRLRAKARSARAEPAAQRTRGPKRARKKR
jgi:DNA end-binding protein Ku